MQIRWLRSFLLIILGSGIIACGSTPQRVQPIRIGVIGPFSGEYIENGNATRQATELAIKDSMPNGGLQVGTEKRPIELVFGDEQNNPEIAVEVAKQLINRDGVVALIGAPFSSIAIPVGGVADQAGIPFISSTSTNPKTTEGRLFVFRATFTDPFQGQVLANFAKNGLNVSNAAVLFDASSEYSRGLAEFFRTDFTKQGGTIVAYETYIQGATDWTEQLKRIQASGAEVIFLPNDYLDVPIQAQQARDLGIIQPLLGGDSWDISAFASNPVFENSYVSQSWHPDLADVKAQTFIKAYQEQYNKIPYEIEANTYDAMGLLLNAITTNASTDGNAIRAALSNTKAYHGVTGTITFNGTGDPIKSAVIVKIVDGTSRYYEQVDPVP